MLRNRRSPFLHCMSPTPLQCLGYVVGAVVFSGRKDPLLLILSSCLAVAAVLLMVRTLAVQKGIVCGLTVTAAVSIGCLFELQRLLKFDLKRFIPSAINWGKTRI